MAKAVQPPEPWDMLYYPTTGAGLGAQRAYFKIGDGGSADALARVTAYSISFGGDGEEDEATGIVSAEASHPLSTVHHPLSGWHTLDGRKLDRAPSRAGVYINNGRKIVVK